jgi:hypothetical protein
VSDYGEAKKEMLIRQLKGMDLSEVNKLTIDFAWGGGFAKIDQCVIDYRACRIDSKTVEGSCTALHGKDHDFAVTEVVTNHCGGSPQLEYVFTCNTCGQKVYADEQV